MIKKITSLENREVKHVIKLYNKSKLRRESRSFIVEGKREIKLAFENGFQLEKIYFNPNIVERNRVIDEFGSDLIEVNNDVYSKISLRNTTEGIVAIVNEKKNISNLNTGNKNLVLVLDGVEKPGNLGAIFRSCDAANVDLIILTNQKCDLYNPNIIRSSLGTVFTQNIIQLKTNDALNLLKKHHFSIFATSLKATKNYDSVSYDQSTAIVVGSENLGISLFWQKNSDNLIKIPMLGSIDSLNVSVSAALTLFEVNRQNKFNR